ncbi:hypothetical protein MP228_001988 [Amoeboaphelidium protococcarum]|nr:hypothetical protein MP228_001988 [Amoeboaphelidium protococcarum]
MIPPKFSEIGKSANDLLSKDIPVGVTKLEVKTTASGGMQFSVNGNQDAKSGAITAELKQKLVQKQRGLTVTGTWFTSNVFGGEVELADSLVKGLKLSLNGQVLPNVNQKAVKVGAEYKQDHVFTNVNLDAFKGPTLSADAAFGVEGFVAGGEVAYNVADGKVNKFGAALGYSTFDYSVALHGVNNFSTFQASYYHRVAADLEIGAKAAWDKKSATSNVNLELGGKYAMDRDTFVKGKVNNQGIVSLGLTQSVRPGLKVSLGGQFDSARLGENAHKFGLALTFEA